MTGPLVDLTGRSFGRLKVIGRAPNNKRGRAMWQCLCECGVLHATDPSALVLGRTISCGCWHRKKQKEAPTKHGLHDTPEYEIWCAMKQRCKNPKHKFFKNYGGRGITVCERWDKFENFITDMGPRPSPELTIDRINNDAGYSPDNCRWTTRIEQRRNQRKTCDARMEM